MNTKVLSLVVLTTFAVSAFSVMPAYASTPQQVSVKIDVYAPMVITTYPQLALNSSNYFTVSYLQNGGGQTLHLYQNTTINVDVNTIVTVSGISQQSNMLVWGQGNFNGLSVLVNASTTLHIDYTIDTARVSAYLLFNDKPYSSSMGVLKSIGGWGFANYDSTGLALVSRYFGANINAVITVPEYFVSDSGQYWQLQGNANLTVVPSFPFSSPSTFNYVPISSAPSALFSVSVPKQVKISSEFYMTISFPFPVQNAGINITGAEYDTNPPSPIINYLESGSSVSYPMIVASVGSRNITTMVNFPSTVLAPAATSGAVAQIQQSTYSVSKITAIQIIPPNESINFGETGLPSGLGYVTIRSFNESLPYSMTTAYGSQVAFSFPATLRSNDTVYVLTSSFPQSITVNESITETANYIAVQPVHILQYVYVNKYNKTVNVPFIPFWVVLVILGLGAAADISMMIAYREHRRSKRREDEGGDNI